MITIVFFFFLYLWQYLNLIILELKFHSRLWLVLVSHTAKLVFVFSIVRISRDDMITVPDSYSPSEKEQDHAQ